MDLLVTVDDKVNPFRGPRRARDFVSAQSAFSLDVAVIDRRECLGLPMLFDTD